MLVLTRKEGQRIVIGDIVITCVELRGRKVRLGIHAPPEVAIWREELQLAGKTSRRPAEAQT